MGFESITLKKLHSFLVAADATCSRGDLPVATVDARLAAVPGLATAAAPTVPAAAEPELLSAANGAAQALNNPRAQIKPIQRIEMKRKYRKLFTATRDIKYTSSP